MGLLFTVCTDARVCVLISLSLCLGCSVTCNMESDGWDTEIVPNPRPALERTLAIIKPEALSYADKIEQTIKDEGFDIIQVWASHLH
jgi:hypothetical protein